MDKVLTAEQAVTGIGDGATLAAFFTPAGIGSRIAEGGLPWRYAPGSTPT